MRVLFLLFTSLFFNFFASANILSERAWQEIRPIYQKITSHPFNRELHNGSLKRKTFEFYKGQDAYYLKSFSKALSMLAVKLTDLGDIQFILDQARGSLDEDLSSEVISFNKITPSNFSYSHFLISEGALASPAELVAAILPCYWIYLEVAKSMKNITSDHPYKKWIELYSSNDYEKTVKKMIKLFNKLSAKADQNIHKKMMDNFKIAAHLEYQFWDDSYFRRVILKDSKRDSK